ncbi:fucose permease [Arcanobacterium pluranimalium]|uniref:MFS transporter n=1 Tax=Arcanobacterium pluranimalium TaxID=108028 RepID=UPI00195E1160|nr:MFS transporter [Arcanobacterium pluranimalium]MBM7824183.1 fucose permease [Arcanobacterium pluranimalium]
MTLLLAVIYAAFVSLGLPDAVVGASWPSLASSLHVDPAGAGVVSMIVCIGTITASFASAALIARFGTVKISITSVALTAVTLLGYALAPSFLWLCIFALPLGLGAGAIDAAINAFVSLNYSTRHNNWLHAFWGVGASLGPLIVGFWLNWRGQWRPAYVTVALLQFALMFLLIASRKLWASTERSSTADDFSHDDAAAQLTPWYRLPHIAPILCGFFFYCAVELTTGLWGATFLVSYHGVTPSLAAAGSAGFYIGITGGRFIAGFAAKKLSNLALLRVGSVIMAIGAVISLFSPLALGAVAGFIMIGLGCAPIYPVILKETARRLGAANTQRAMGLQMGFAYTGQLLMPPAVGYLMTRIDPVLMPIFALLGTLAMIGCHEYVEKTVREKK